MSEERGEKDDRRLIRQGSLHWWNDRSVCPRVVVDIVDTYQEALALLGRSYLRRRITMPSGWCVRFTASSRAAASAQTLRNSAPIWRVICAALVHRWTSRLRLPPSERSSKRVTNELAVLREGLIEE